MSTPLQNHLILIFNLTRSIHTHLILYTRVILNATPDLINLSLFDPFLHLSLDSLKLSSIQLNINNLNVIFSP